MVDLSKTHPSKNLVDVTNVNPYIDRLIRILMSPTNARQSTDQKPGKDGFNNYGLNLGLDDPHDLLKENAHLTHKQILQMLMDNTLMNDLHQSHVKGEPLYEGLADPTYPYPNR